MRICPHCKNDGRQAAIFDLLTSIHEDIYNIECICNGCGAWWTEHYNDVTGKITVVDIGTPQNRNAT